MPALLCGAAIGSDETITTSGMFAASDRKHRRANKSDGKTQDPCSRHCKGRDAKGQAIERSAHMRYPKIAETEPCPNGVRGQPVLFAGLLSGGRLSGLLSLIALMRQIPS